jgi:hypothetical protein
MRQEVTHRTLTLGDPETRRPRRANEYVSSSCMTYEGLAIDEGTR